VYCSTPAVECLYQQSFVRINTHGKIGNIGLQRMATQECLAYLVRQTSQTWFSRPATADLHVKWIPCHHGTARPQVADRGDGLQIWRVGADILNKQSRTVDRDGLQLVSWGGGLTTPHHKKYL
jgi:hypothetical protein